VKRSAETALKIIGKLSKTVGGGKSYPYCAWTRAAPAVFGVRSGRRESFGPNLFFGEGGEAFTGG